MADAGSRIEACRGAAFGLSAGIVTRDPKRMRHVKAHSQAGMAVIGGSTAAKIVYRS